VGYLAHLCGLRPRGVECTPRELIADFDLRVLSSGPVRGDEHGLRGGE
jgi:hypothetical protein